MDYPKHIYVDGFRWCLSKDYYKRSVFISLHRHVWERKNGPIPDGHHIHHIDGNKKNNSIENLECLSESDHHKKHWKENYEKMALHLAKNRRIYERSDAQRESFSKWSKKFWVDKEATEVECPICKKKSFCKMPTLFKKCRKCQKDTHYADNQVERACKLCNIKFICYKYSHTFTCSQKCAVRSGWATKRQRNELASIEPDS